jgi:Calcineurin-like phosphoesterase
MGRYYELKVILAVVLVLAVVILITSGPPPVAPNPPGTFSFAVLGDAPYYWWEDLKYRVVLQDLHNHDLRWVLHIGDIFWRPCTDERYRESLDQFNHLRHPVIYTPGDNEWFDCWEPRSGAFQPRERLSRIREIFFGTPAHSLGGRRLPLMSQAADETFSEFVENVRWVQEGILFVTVHLVGSMNGLKTFPGCTAADDAAARRRTEAAAAWVRESFAEAKAGGASAVVIGFHANPGFQEPAGDPYRQAYEPFMAALEEEVERYGKPVLVVQGDDHTYTVDHPLVRRTTGRRLGNLTRMQVPGSPEVGWVRVVVRPGARSTFSFESRVVPSWKYW